MSAMGCFVFEAYLELFLGFKHEQWENIIRF